MKVLQIVPELNAGGVERGTLEVANYLVKEGHESIVISNGGRLVAQLETQGSRHHALPVHRKSLLSLRQVGPLRDLFRTESPDLVHVRSRVPAWLAWLAWRKMDPATRPRFVSTMHGLHSVNAYSRIMTRGERVIAPSETVRRYILDNFPQTDPAVIRVIPRGIDPEVYPYRFQPAADWLDRWRDEHPNLAGRFVITLPARISPIKGQTDLVRILARLHRDNVPAHGLLVGSTHPRRAKHLDSVRQLVAHERLGDHVTILDHRDDLREIMAISNVVVSLTHQPESFGRSSLEALSLGIPVAAYAHGGVAEQLDCFLPEGAIPPNDLDAAAALLASWHRNGPPIPPRKRNHPFTLDAMLRSTLGVYRELV